MIVGTSGFAGSGKDTVNRIIKNELESIGLSCSYISFADPIKSICHQLFGWDINRLTNDFVYKENNLDIDGNVDIACRTFDMTKRDMMQKIGTAAFRQGIDSEFWINLYKIHKEIHNTLVDVEIVADCRFLNELDFVDYHIQISNISRPYITSNPSHISEVEWIQWQDWEFILDNSPSEYLTMAENLENLRYSIEPIIMDIVRKLR